MSVPDIRQISTATSMHNKSFATSLGWFDLLLAGAGECL